jgi:hypothetical protein
MEQTKIRSYLIRTVNRRYNTGGTQFRQAV